MLNMYDFSFFLLFQANEELKRQLAAQQKLVEKTKEQLQRCHDVTKQLLIEKVIYAPIKDCLYNLEIYDKKYYHMSRLQKQVFEASYS